MIHWNYSNQNNTIRIENGQMRLGNELLTDMISGAAASLPRHSHTYQRHNDYYFFDGIDNYGKLEEEQDLEIKIYDPNNNYIGSGHIYITHHIDESDGYSTSEVGG